LDVARSHVARARSSTPGLPRRAASRPAAAQEEYLRAEMRALSRELLRAAEEIDRIKAVPLTLVRPPALLFILFF